MSWMTDAQKVAFDAGQGVAEATNAVGDWFNSIFSGTVDSIGSFFRGSSVIGINVNEIPNMRNAIRDYVKSIHAHLDEVKTAVDTNMAFKGEYAQAITPYVEAIAETCKGITSQLLAFSDQLKEIQDAYQAQNAELASKIKATTAAAASNTTKYEEKY